MRRLYVKCPFALAHHRLRCSISGASVDVHLRGADHKVHVVEAGVASGGVELFIAQFLATCQGEAIGASDGDMAGGVLIVERVVEEMPALGNWRTGRDQ